MILEQANADAHRLIEDSKAYADNIDIRARGDGITALFAYLNYTESETTSKMVIILFMF